MERDAQKVLVSTIRRLLRAGQEQQVRKIISKVHPADLAAVLRGLTVGQQVAVFGCIEDMSRRGLVLSELDPGMLSELLGELSDEDLSEVIDVMPSDDTNYVLQALDDERSHTLVEAMSDDYQTEATSIMGYHSGSAGALMVTDFLALDEETTAGEAVRIVQGGADGAEIVFYIYVTNQLGQLVGVTSLRELVQQAPGRALKEFMIADVIRVHVETEQEEVARLVAKYNLLALPVVEGGNTLAGVVTVDDVIDVIRDEANEDMLRMAGVGNEDISAYENPWDNARTRLPWLSPGLVTGTIGILLIHLFLGMLEPMTVLVLVVFLPMVLALSRNVGMQSATIVTRASKMGQVDWERPARVVRRELGVGLACGVVYGLVVGGIMAGYGVWSQAVDVWSLGITGWLAVSVSMGVSTLAGAVTPLLLDRWELDASWATGPFLASGMDVATTAVYLGMAVLFLA